MATIIPSESINNKINRFYNNRSSIAHTNKYIVGFYGPKVTAAVNTISNIIGADIAKKLLRIGSASSPIDKETNIECNFVELQWECSDITIPTGDLIVDKSSHFFDFEKAIKHSYILGIQDIGELKMKIVDTKEMIWYQFFNAIKNSFFDTNYFRPVGSSFNKLACYIQVLQGTGNTSTGNEIGTDGTFNGQLFEFNSIVPVKFDAITLKHNADEPFSFNITFNAPNVFQGTYNKNFAGLRTMTTYATQGNTSTTDIKNFYLTKLEGSHNENYATNYTRIVTEGEKVKLGKYI